MTAAIRLLDPLVAALLALALGLELFIGAASAELVEPSLNLAAHGVLAAALALAAARAAIAGEAVVPAPRVAIPLAAVVAAAWLSLANADDLHAGLRRAAAWTAAAAFLGLAIATVERGGPAARRALVAAALAAGAVLAGLALKERRIDLPEAREAFVRDPAIAAVAPEMAQDFRARLFSDQASGPFLIPNGLGAFFAVVAVAAIAGIGVWGAPLAAASVLGIALAGQKGGWVGLAAGLAIAALPRRAAAGLIAAGAVAWVGALALVPAERLERLPGGTSLAVRKEYSIAALRVAAEYPGLGAGAGNYQMHATRVKPERGEEAKYAHDDYLEMLAECGVVGVAGLVGLWVGLVGVRRPRFENENENEGHGTTVAIGAGVAVAILLLPLLGLRYRNPWVVSVMVVAFGAIYALLTRVKTISAAGALGAAGAFAVQAAIDFLHVEAGLLYVALALAAAGGGPALGRRVALPAPLRAAAPAAAAALFLAIALVWLPRAIEFDAASAAGDPEAALAAIPFDVRARAALGDVHYLAFRKARAEADRTAALAHYRTAIGARRGLPDVKLKMAELLPPGPAAAAAWESAALAYPSNPRNRFLAGRALAALGPEAAPRARAHLEAALRLDGVVRHARIRLSPADRAEAQASLDALGDPSYNRAESPRKESPP